MSCWSALLVKPLQEATSDRATLKPLSEPQLTGAAERGLACAQRGWATPLVETSAADPRCPLQSPLLSVLVNQVLIADQAFLSISFSRLMALLPLIYVKGVA